MIKINLLFFLLLFYKTTIAQDTIGPKETVSLANCVFHKKGSSIPFKGIIYTNYLLGGKKLVISVENGVFNGDYKMYYKNGKIKSEGTFLYGDSDGKEINYYKSGVISSIINYQNGLLNGLTTLNFETGEKQEEYEYINGVQDGQYIYYYKNGQIREKGQMINGKRNGTFLNYYEDGFLSFKCPYIDGNKVGDEINYYRDGSRPWIQHHKAK